MLLFGTSICLSFQNSCLLILFTDSLTFFWRSLVLNLAIFLSIFWSNLTILCWNVRSVLFDCACFFRFFLLLISCLILLSYICFDFLILRFGKQSCNIEFSLSDHFSQLLSIQSISFQQSLKILLSVLVIFWNLSQPFMWLKFRTVSRLFLDCDRILLHSNLSIIAL